MEEDQEVHHCGCGAKYNSGSVAEGVPGFQSPIDLARAQAQFYETCPTIADQSSMINFLNPSVGICCNQAVGKGKLKLVAYGQLAKLDPKSTYKVRGYSLYPPKSCSDMEKLDGKSVLIPFWYIKHGSEPDQVNMVMTHSNKGGFQIPMFVNDRPLEARELLFSLAPSKASGGPKAGQKRKST